MSNHLTPSTLAVVHQMQLVGMPNPAMPQRLVHLTGAQAAAWLHYLERMHASNRPGKNSEPAVENLEQLRDQLADASWLACWKRENVILELSMSMLPGLLEELLALSQRDQTKKDLDILEELIFELVVNQQA